MREVHPLHKLRLRYIASVSRLWKLIKLFIFCRGDAKLLTIMYGVHLLYHYIVVFKSRDWGAQK